VVHGLRGTGKSSVVEAVLKYVGTPNAIVQSRESITSRHLLEKAAFASAATCRSFLGDVSVPASQPRCESVNSLATHLERILRQVPKLILVFDGIDKQREAQPSLIPGLVRLGSIVRNVLSSERMALMVL
jgi:origin recognition complex subunit 5